MTLLLSRGFDEQAQKILHGAGYLRLRDLANASASELQQVFLGHGSRFRFTDFESWSNQASLRVLVAQQREQQPLSTSEAESPGSSLPDDLTMISGIGPVAEQVLCDHGIVRFEQVAEMSVQQLSELFYDDPNKFQMLDPSTWPARRHWLLKA